MLQASLIKILMDTRIRLIVWMLLLVFLAHQLAILFWQFYPRPEINSAMLTTPAAQTRIDRAGQLNRLEKAKIIASSNLFGEVEVEQVEQQVVETGTGKLSSIINCGVFIFRKKLLFLQLLLKLNLMIVSITISVMNWLRILLFRRLQEIIF